MKNFIILVLSSVIAGPVIVGSSTLMFFFEGFSVQRVMSIILASLFWIFFFNRFMNPKDIKDVKTFGMFRVMLIIVFVVLIYSYFFEQYLSLIFQLI